MRERMSSAAVWVAFLWLGCVAFAQAPATMLSSLTRPQDYVLKRFSSFDRTGANHDSRDIAPGDTLVLVDAAGPGMISHIWITIAAREPHHLKKLVEAGLLAREQRGRWAYFSLRREALEKLALVADVQGAW